MVHAAARALRPQPGDLMLTSSPGLGLYYAQLETDTWSRCPHGNGSRFSSPREWLQPLAAPIPVRLRAQAMPPPEFRGTARFPTPPTPHVSARSVVSHAARRSLAVLASRAIPSGPDALRLVMRACRLAPEYGRISGPRLDSMAPVAANATAATVFLVLRVKASNRRTCPDGSSRTASARIRLPPPRVRRPTAGRELPGRCCCFIALQTS